MISQHFKRSEFVCPCGCGQDTVDVELIEVLEDLHKHFDKIYGKCYVHINSGNRCKKHNATIKGSSKTSLHIVSKASDVYLYYYENSIRKIITSEEVYIYLTKKYPNKYGIIKHHSFNHIDVRKSKFHAIV